VVAVQLACRGRVAAGMEGGNVALAARWHEAALHEMVAVRGKVRCEAESGEERKKGCRGKVLVA
jgi:hypothetical protein